MIEIRDLNKYYGERRAVGPLDASIAAGEVVGLLGLNGAGKTTTLRILACDLLPSSGSVTVDGIDVVERPHEVRSRIGYLPDVPPLYPEMTVRAYLSFAARLRGIRRADADRRAREVEELTDLGDVADEPIASLSHGFKQRVGIAQAIVHGPKLLVLDEPISGLDPVQIVEMRELLRSLRGEHTILLSSHILSEISETCDRLLVIKEGRIAAAGTEAELTHELRRGLHVTVTVGAGSSGAGDTASAGDVARVERLRASVRERLEKIQGVRTVEPVTTGEAPADVATFHVDADHDVRAEIGRAIVGAELDLLQLVQSERELESLFLELARPTETASAPRKKKRKTSATSSVSSTSRGDAETGRGEGS